MRVVHLDSIADDLDRLEPTPVPRATEVEHPRQPFEIVAPGPAIGPRWPGNQRLPDDEVRRRLVSARVMVCAERRITAKWRERALAAEAALDELLEAFGEDEP